MAVSSKAAGPASAIASNSIRKPASCVAVAGGKSARSTCSASIASRSTNASAYVANGVPVGVNVGSTFVVASVCTVRCRMPICASSLP